MPTINMFDAKSQLSRLVDSVESGAEPEVIIARNGRPAARLVPIAGGPSGRRIGIAKGKFRMPETIDGDDDAIAALFSGSAP